MLEGGDDNHEETHPDELGRVQLAFDNSFGWLWLIKSHRYIRLYFIPRSAMTSY